MTTKAAERRAVHGTGKVYWQRLGADIRRSKWLYLLLIPGLIYFSCRRKRQLHLFGGYHEPNLLLLSRRKA